MVRFGFESYENEYATDMTEHFISEIVPPA